MESKKRNRKRSAINTDNAAAVFGKLLEHVEGDSLTATQLGRASNTWRKILTYLRSPSGTAERIEAENAIEQIGLEYEDGEFNSRTFYPANDDNQWIKTPQSNGGYILADLNVAVHEGAFNSGQCSMTLLAGNSPAWKALIDDLKGSNPERAKSMLDKLGLAARHALIYRL